MPKTQRKTSGLPSGQLVQAAVLRTPQSLVSSRPFNFNGTAADLENAASCLAAAAWYEAGDDTIGQKAVIQTAINRVKHPSFPNSVCGVVFQGSQRDSGCQFTFTCDGSLLRRRPTEAAWQRALALSKQALSGAVDKSVGQATHYHATYVDPWWSGKLERLATVGLHVFYRWPGGRGSLARGNRTLAEESYSLLVSEAIHTSKATLELAAEKGKDQIGPSLTSDLGVNGLAGTPGGAADRRDQAIIMASTGHGESGRWAIAALNACREKLDCQVLFYEDIQSVNRNRLLQSSNRERPLFLFIKDASSQMVVKLWDCEKIARPTAEQCLPTKVPALRFLMRERTKLPNIASETATQRSS